MALSRAALATRMIARRVTTSVPSAAMVRAFASGPITPDVVRGTKKVVEQKDDLPAVLAKELDYEKEDDASAQALKDIAKSITDFEITDAAGSARFQLTKKVGSQVIRIDLDCSPVPTDGDENMEDEEHAHEEGEEGDEGMKEGYRMIVTITDTGKGRTVQVGGMVGEGLQIHRVTNYKAGAEPSPDQIFGGYDESPVYAGPAFEELDVSLQTAFYEYLAERGIDDELAANLADYCANKEQQEYVHWLKSMKEFVA